MATIDLGQLSASQGVTIFGADSGAASSSIFGDLSGYSVSDGGDINGDGFDDLLIGAPMADSLNNSKVSAGESYVVFGNPSLPSTIDLANLGGRGITILGGDLRDASGRSISAAGDVNGDGFDDFIVGAWLADSIFNLRLDGGDSSLIFGGPALPSTLDLSYIGNRGVMLFGGEIDARSGISVSTAGDINGDGFDDLLVGAYRAAGFAPPSDFEVAGGKSYVLFGRKTFPLTIDFGNLGTDGVVVIGDNAGDFSGWSVSNAGDFNGDGLDDFVVGAYKADALGNAKSSAGESYLVFGRARMPGTIFLNGLGTEGTKIFGASTGDHSGYSVSGAGDVNGDGLDDLLLGAPRASQGIAPNVFSGKSYVVFGTPTFSPTIDLAQIGTPQGFAGITILGVDPNDYSGLSVSSAGDFNGDGFDDFIVGAPEADGAGNTKESAGESYLVLGGPSLTSTIDLRSLGAKGITFLGADARDRSGRSVSQAGDVNGDGFDDLIISAYQADSFNNAKQDAGESYVIYGSDFTSTATRVGTASPETITGTSAIDVVIAGRGDDVLVGNGGSDVLIGGHGNDTLAVENLSFRRIVGGTGQDTLRFDGKDLIIDLTSTADNHIKGIEQIDIAGIGRNSLILSQREVLNLSDESNIITIRGKAGDRIAIRDAWTNSPNETIGGRQYAVLRNREAVLKIDSALSIVFVPSNVLSHQNPANKFDVNADGVVAPIDVLITINALMRNGSNASILTLPYSPQPYCDVDNDTFLSPIDVLQVINFLSRRAASGEGEGRVVNWSLSSPFPINAEKLLNRYEESIDREQNTITEVLFLDFIDETQVVEKRSSLTSKMANDESTTEAQNTFCFDEILSGYSEEDFLRVSFNV